MLQNQIHYSLCLNIPPRPLPSHPPPRELESLITVRTVWGIKKGHSGEGCNYWSGKVLQYGLKYHKYFWQIYKVLRRVISSKIYKFILKQKNNQNLQTSYSLKKSNLFFISDENPPSFSLTLWFCIFWFVCVHACSWAVWLHISIRSYALSHVKKPALSSAASTRC